MVQVGFIPSKNWLEHIELNEFHIFFLNLPQAMLARSRRIPCLFGTRFGVRLVTFNLAFDGLGYLTLVKSLRCFP